jgi:hypothetical protein
MADPAASTSVLNDPAAAATIRQYLGQIGRKGGSTTRDNGKLAQNRATALAVLAQRKAARATATEPDADLSPKGTEDGTT